MKFDIRKITNEILDELSDYITQQLSSLYPNPNASKNEDKLVIKHGLPLAILRMKEIKRVAVPYDVNIFYTYHSMEYSTFLYIISNTIYLTNGNKHIELCDRLFLLNRSLNSIDLFYKNNMPPIFIIAHGLGCVIGNAEYGNNLIFFQNTTIGRVGNDSPKIGDNVIIYPNCVITGKTVIGSNCVISAGSIVHNRIVPDNSLVKFSGNEIILSPLNKNYLEHYFRGI
jgi:serine O-acetyltransferase